MLNYIYAILRVLRPEPPEPPEPPPAPEPDIEVVDFAGFLAALEDPEVDVIGIPEGAEIVVPDPANINTPGLLIDRKVTLVGEGTIASGDTTDAPITFIRVNADDVEFYGITIAHRRPTPSAGQIDRAVYLSAEGFKAYDVNVEFMEFGYWIEGQFHIQGGGTTYTGPLGNTHRHFGLYSMTGDSKVEDFTFDFPFEAVPRSAFMLSDQGQPTRKFDGKLTLRNVAQKTVSTSVSNPAEYYYMSQFFNQASFAAPGNRDNMAVEFDSCSWDDVSGGIFIFNNTDNPLDFYQSFVVRDCVQGDETLIDSFNRAPFGDATDPPRFKGMFFLDGTSGSGRPIGDLSVLVLEGNTVPANGATLRPTYSFVTPPGQQENVFAINTDRFTE